MFSGTFFWSTQMCTVYEGVTSHSYPSDCIHVRTWQQNRQIRLGRDCPEVLRAVDTVGCLKVGLWLSFVSKKKDLRVC